MCDLDDQAPETQQVQSEQQTQKHMIRSQEGPAALCAGQRQSRGCETPAEAGPSEVCTAPALGGSQKIPPKKQSPASVPNVRVEPECARSTGTPTKQLRENQIRMECQGPAGRVQTWAPEKCAPGPRDRPPGRRRSQSTSSTRGHSTDTVREQAPQTRKGQIYTRETRGLKVVCSARPALLTG